MNDTTLELPTPEKIQALIRHAVRAPSVLNTQPWRFVIDGATIHLYADRSRQLEALDPDGRELTISCGAALFYLHTAAQHAGWTVELAILPQGDAPDLLASVTLHAGSASLSNDRLFRALSLRTTNRLPFTSEPASPQVIGLMTEAAATHGATLHTFDSASHLSFLSGLVSEGILIQSQNDAVVDDIQTWLRPSTDPRPDGVRDSVQGAWDRHAMMRTPPSSVAAYKARLIRDAPAVLILTTATDDPAAWLAAGQALAHALVLAADYGLAASYANEPIEVDSVRRTVASLVNDQVPQILFRVGTPEVEPETARRRASDVSETI